MTANIMPLLPSPFDRRTACTQQKRPACCYASAMRWIMLINLGFCLLMHPAQAAILVAKPSVAELLVADRQGRPLAGAWSLSRNVVLAAGYKQDWPFVVQKGGSQAFTQNVRGNDGGNFPEVLPPRVAPHRLEVTNVCRGIAATVPWLAERGGVPHVFFVQQPGGQPANSATGKQNKGAGENESGLSPDQKRARDAFLAGRWEEAQRLLEEAAKLTPQSSVPPKVLLARWCAEAGQLPQARAFLEQAARDDPRHPEVFLTNAHFAFLEGRLTDMILNCQAALEASDSPRWEAGYKQQVRLQARLGLAAAYEARRDFLNALAQLREILQTDARNAVIRQRLARLLFLLDRTEEALQQWEQARRDDPTIEPAELQLAQLCVLRRDYDQATKWFSKAATSYPEDVRVRRLYAVFLLEQGRYDQAQPQVQAVQRLEPDSRDTRALLGYCARHQRDYATAIRIFEELVRDYPSYPFALVNLALLLAESGDAKTRQRAVALAENNVRLQPLLSDGRAVLAYALYRAGREAEAERVARSVLGVGPLSPDGAYLAAVVLQARGNRDDARSLLETALQSKDPMFYRKEAELLAQQLAVPKPLPETGKHAP